MQLVVNGIVLQEKLLQNDNRLLTILTQHHGVLRAFAKAVKRLGSGLSAPTELLSYSSFVLFSHKDRYSIDKAESLKIFFQIRQDLEKLSLASYLAELTAALAPEQEESQEFLRLLLNSLWLLDSGKRSVSFLKPVYELRLLTLSGYMPDLVGCQCCGAGSFDGQAPLFFPELGCLFCKDCVEPYAGRICQALSPDLLAAMRHILYARLESLFQFKMSPAGLDQLGQVVEQYLLVQLERSFPSLEFYKSISGMAALA